MPAQAATNLETVNISNTYYGLLHAGGVPIPSTGQPLIRDGSGTPTALRLGANCNGATICGTLSATTLAGGNLNLDTKLTPTQINILELVKVLYPINAVIYTTDNVNPGTRLGWVGTTWTQIAQGRFIVGVGTGIDNRGESKAFAAENTYGEYNHILTEAQMPNHNHGTKMGQARGMSSGCYAGGAQTGLDSSCGTRDTTNTGGDQPHNNIPPGFGLWVWKRTA